MSNEPDKVNSGALATLVVLLALAMLGASLTITALVRVEEAELGAERAAPAENAYRSLRAEQLAKLNAPSAWTDRAKGLVSVPIDRATKLMLGDIRHGRTWVGELPPKKEAPQGSGGEAGAESPEGTPSEAAPSPEGSPAPAPTGGDSGTPSLSPTPGSTGPGPTPAPQKAPEAPKKTAPESAPAPEGTPL